MAGSTYGLGGVRFRYLSRGIDLTTRNPEIEINGANSRAIFRLRGEPRTALAAPCLWSGWWEWRQADREADAGEPSSGRL